MFDQDTLGLRLCQIRYRLSANTNFHEKATSVLGLFQFGWANKIKTWSELKKSLFISSTPSSVIRSACCLLWESTRFAKEVNQNIMF
jgi:hypothetical protein